MSKMMVWKSLTPQTINGWIFSGIFTRVCASQVARRITRWAVGEPDFQLRWRGGFFPFPPDMMGSFVNHMPSKTASLRCETHTKTSTPQINIWRIIPNLYALLIFMAKVPHVRKQGWNIMKNRNPTKPWRYATELHDTNPLPMRLPLTHKIPRAKGPRVKRYCFFTPPEIEHDNWNIKHLKMYLLFNMVIFHCHVSFFWGGGYDEMPTYFWGSASWVGRLDSQRCLDLVKTWLMNYIYCTKQYKPMFIYIYIIY